MTNTSDKILKFFKREHVDPDLQAGSRGLTVAETVTRYLRTPGQVLSLLRLARGVQLEEVASSVGIPTNELLELEKGTKQPSLKTLADLSKYFGADLRALLEVFGHVNDNASSDSIGLAAQFGGELSAEERLDLRRLLAGFSGKGDGNENGD